MRGLTWLHNRLWIWIDHKLSISLNVIENIFEFLWNFKNLWLLIAYKSWNVHIIGHTYEYRPTLRLVTPHISHISHISHTLYWSQRVIQQNLSQISHKFRLVTVTPFQKYNMANMYYVITHFSHIPRRKECIIINFCRDYIITHIYEKLFYKDKSPIQSGYE